MSLENNPEIVPESTETPEITIEVGKKIRAPKDPSKLLNIINGRMPFPLVYLIRFIEPATVSSTELAKKFGTSVGKVFDIRKLANFGYIDANYLASEDELAAAKAWASTAVTLKGETLAEIGGDSASILAMLDTLAMASAEQIAARVWKIRVIGEKAPLAEGEVAAPKAPRTPRAKKVDAVQAAPVAAANLF